MTLSLPLPIKRRNFRSRDLLTLSPESIHAIILVPTFTSCSIVGDKAACVSLSVDKIMDIPTRNTAVDPVAEAAAYKRLYPRKYLARFLQEDQRSDGRSVHGWRDVAINVGECVLMCSQLATYHRFSQLTGAISTANGSALVRLGDTTIICGIKAEIAQPDWDRPAEGWIGML